jgi:hypothetical protein
MHSERPKERQTRFVAKLLTSDLLSWEETADTDAFQAKLDKFVVQVARRFENFDNEPYYGVLLFNSSGRLLEEIYPGQLDSALFQELTGLSKDSGLESLFERARRDALNVDAALDEATKDLDRYRF